MKFLVKAFRNGNEVTWVYDSATSFVWDENGIQQLTQFEPPLHYDEKLPFTRTNNPNKKEKDLHLLEILLGYKCNLDCEYCSQAEYRKSDKCIENGRVRDVGPFIEKLKTNGITPGRIQLWGGEPLVYWKVIEALVPKLRELYPADKTAISIITNGTLLDCKKMAFFAKHGCSVFVSADGDDVRRGDKLFSQPNAIMALQWAEKNAPNHYGLGATPSPGNSDIKKVIQIFRDKGFKSAYIGVHNIARCHNSLDKRQVDTCTFSEEELTRYSDAVFELLNSQPPKLSLNHRLDAFVRTLIDKKGIEKVSAECELPFSKGLVVDLKGNVYTCHNNAEKGVYCGHLDRYDEIVGLGYNHWSNKQRCIECPFIHGCKGGCPSADDKANELACPNLKALYWGVFRAAFAALFGLYVTEITILQEEK